MGTPHAPTGTGGESNDSPKNDHPLDASTSSENSRVDKIVAGLSSLNLTARADSEADTDTDTDNGTDTDTDTDAHNDDHVPEPATVRRWEVIDRIMDSFSSKLEAKMTQTTAASVLPPQLAPKPAVLVRRCFVEDVTTGAAEGRLREKAAEVEPDQVDEKGKRDESPGNQEEIMATSADVTYHASFGATPPPPPPPESTSDQLMSKGKKLAGSSFMGLFSRKQTARSSGTDSPSFFSASESAPPPPPQPPAPSSAPGARPLASATSSLRTLAPAPPRATAAPAATTAPAAPATDTSSHLGGILGTLVSALSSGGTQDVPAHLPHVVGEERDHLRDRLEDMYTRQNPMVPPASARGGPLFGSATPPFGQAVHAHTRSAQVPPMPSQRGLVHTSMSTAPLSSRSTPHASHSTWQAPSATASAPGYGFAGLGSAGQSGGQELHSSAQGVPRQEFQAENQISPTPTQDVGGNSGFRGLGLPGFPQPHIHMHRNVALQEPTPPDHASTSPPSDQAEAEDGEHQPGRRRRSRASHLGVDDVIASDHDGRRKKARKSSSANIASGGQRKFACPYFKRNKTKYSKWTSCPGPGWDEVHRVKYASLLSSVWRLLTMPERTFTGDMPSPFNVYGAGRSSRQMSFSTPISSKTPRARRGRTRHWLRASQKTRKRGFGAGKRRRQTPPTRTSGARST